MQRDIKIQEQQSFSKGKKGVRLYGGIKKSETQQFHKTKLLLSIYRTVVWRIETAIYEIQETTQDYGSDRISELVNFLSLELDDFNLTNDKKAIEERLMCIAETKQIIEIVDKALIHLKTHPKNGQIYHQIITYSYIDKDMICDEVIMKKLSLTQSTYYRYKKQATELMGIALWGYIIPPLKEYWDNLK